MGECPVNTGSAEGDPAVRDFWGEYRLPLKDECETPQPIEGVEPSDKDFPLKKVSVEDANDFMEVRKKMHRRSQLQLQPVSSVRQF